MRIHTRRLPRLRIRRNGRGHPIGLYLLIILILILLSVVLIDAQVGPIVREYAYNRAVYLATSTVNDAVNEVITDSGISYQDLIHLMTDDSGAISALVSNSVAINNLKTTIITNVLDRLERLENTRLRIPLGSITGFDILSGAGPVMNLSVVPLGSASASFGSSFQAAGINQTLHKIYLSVMAQVTIILPGKSIDAQIEVQVDVAETIIVGTVPDSYTNVEDATGGEITDEIFTFADLA